MFSCLLILGCTGPKKLANTGNADKGWTKLFNGTDINDWFVKINHHLVGENYGNTFRVEDGMIRVSYDQYSDFNDQFGHLYYKTPFSYYHLRFEYRFVGKQQKGAPDYTLLNSGVIFPVGLGFPSPRPPNNCISIDIGQSWSFSIVRGSCE